MRRTNSSAFAIAPSRCSVSGCGAWVPSSLRARQRYLSKRRASCAWGGAQFCAPEPKASSTTPIAPTTRCIPMPLSASRRLSTLSMQVCGTAAGRVNRSTARRLLIRRLAVERAPASAPGSQPNGNVSSMRRDLSSIRLGLQRSPPRMLAKVSPSSPTPRSQSGRSARLHFKWRDVVWRCYPSAWQRHRLHPRRASPS